MDDGLEDDMYRIIFYLPHFSFVSNFGLAYAQAMQCIRQNMYDGRCDSYGHLSFTRSYQFESLMKWFVDGN